MPHLSSPTLPRWACPLAALALLAAVGAAQAQTPASFAAASNYSVINQPLDVAVADVNGDGRPDIVTANPGYSTVAVLLGRAGGGFVTATTYSTGTNIFPYAVAVADMNGDGRLDLVTANGHNGTAGVLLGLAGGGFTTAIIYPTGGAPFGVAVFDVNGDGRPDIVTANGGNAGSTVRVLLGRAGGGFAAAMTYLAGGSPTDVAVADVNGDGQPDIVTNNGNTSTAGVLLGLAGGGFAAASTYPTGANSFPSDMAVVDMNGDGRLDIVTANQGNSTAGVLLGMASGGFAAASTYPAGGNPAGMAIADVNGDGRPDIVTANNVNNFSGGTTGVLLGRAGGGFAAATTYSAGGNPTDVAVADVNGDGRPDIVTANGGNGGNTVGVLLNTGTFTPLAAATSPAAADVALFPNPARGSFAVQLPAAWGAAPVRAELLNALGQVMRQQTTALPAGATFYFTTEGLAAGVYLLRVQAGGYTLARRVVLD